MWKRGGRSSALERAEALLFTKKRHTTPTNTDTSVVPTNALVSDLNEPSVSLGSEEGVGVMGPSAIEQSGNGGGRRFMKKGLTSAAGSKDPVQHRSEPRYLLSPQRGSQSPASSRLVQHESRSPKSKNRHEMGASTGSPSGQAAMVPSAQLNLNGRRFLKNKAAASPPTTVPKRTESARVSVDSDEEDMKRLLDKPVDSTHRPRRPGTDASVREKTFNRQSHEVKWSSVPFVHRPSPSEPSTPGHSSTFGWTGPAQNLLSPSILSPSPHGPFASPSPPESLVSASRKDTPSCPQRSLSPACSPQAALSLEELFPVGRDSNNSHSQMSSASSEDFKINVMGLDDLAPGFTEEMGEKELCGSSDGLKEEEEEVVLDYHSDFDTLSDSSHISEEIPGEETGSEVRENSAGSQQKTEDDDTSSASETSSSCSSTPSDHSQNTKASDTIHRRGFTEPHGGCTCGWSLRDPGLEHMSKGVPQYVHAFSTYNPSMMVLIEMLKQQLHVTKHFMDRSRHLHSRLVQSLEPPNYKYISLEDAKMVTRTHSHTLTDASHTH